MISRDYAFYIEGFEDYINATKNMLNDFFIEVNTEIVDAIQEFDDND